MVELSVPWGRKAALNDDAHTDALMHNSEVHQCDAFFVGPAECSR